MRHATLHEITPMRQFTLIYIIECAMKDEINNTQKKLFKSTEIGNQPFSHTHTHDLHASHTNK